MIQTDNLTKYFKDLKAVDRVNLHVRSGEVLALLGPNGAGKTTTVRMLTTVLRPSSGSARVAGYDVVKEPGKVRASVGVLTEDHGLYDRMYMEEYLDFFGQIYDMETSRRKERIEHLLKKFGLLDARSRRIGKFSKGMRQKLSLARSLLHSPPVLLLDEPTSAMDPASARLVRDAIKTLRSEDRSIIVCTHNLAEAEELADKIAIIRYGRIIAHGTAVELKEQLLGPGEYRVELADPIGDRKLPSLEEVEVTGQGSSSINFRVESARNSNPRVLEILAGAGFQVVKLEEVQRSLESVYLQAVNHTPLEEAADVD